MPFDTFEDVAEFQGWGVREQLRVALAFVEVNRFNEAFTKYAQFTADKENERIIDA